MSNIFTAYFPLKKGLLVPTASDSLQKNEMATGTFLSAMRSHSSSNNRY